MKKIIFIIVLMAIAYAIYAAFFKTKESAQPETRTLDLDTTAPEELFDRESTCKKRCNRFLAIPVTGPALAINCRRKC